MSVTYRVQRTAMGGLTKESIFNGKQVNINDFLDMAPDFSGLIPKVMSNEVIDAYRITRQEGNMFSEILAKFFAEPYKKDKVLEGKI